jgi:hypothetical protein
MGFDEHVAPYREILENVCKKSKALNMTDFTKSNSLNHARVDPEPSTPTILIA